MIKAKSFERAPLPARKRGTYPNLAAASAIRSRVAEATLSGDWKARETVDIETPASSATSRIVIRDVRSDALMELITLFCRKNR
jgi:hypothetical protein